jgi:hypothetical protein
LRSRWDQSFTLSGAQAAALLRHLHQFGLSKITAYSSCPQRFPGKIPAGGHWPKQTEAVASRQRLIRERFWGLMQPSSWSHGWGSGWLSSSHKTLSKLYGELSDRHGRFVVILVMGGCLVSSGLFVRALAEFDHGGEKKIAAYRNSKFTQTFCDFKLCGV